MKIYLIILILTVISGKQIISFGDSWAVGGYKILEQRIKKDFPNIKLTNFAIGGTTAEQYATRYEALPNAVTLSKANFVWVPQLLIIVINR
jgi:hypothetical protein